MASLPELEVEHRKLAQLAERTRSLRAQNAAMAAEVATLPELKAAAAELQQQVVQLQRVKQQIQRLQVCVCLSPVSPHSSIVMAPYSPSSTRV